MARGTSEGVRKCPKLYRSGTAGLKKRAFVLRLREKCLVVRGLFEDRLGFVREKGCFLEQTPNKLAPIGNEKRQTKQNDQENQSAKNTSKSNFF